jgi:transposase
VRLSTSLKTRIHAVLADRGVRVEDRLWTHARRARLASLDLPPTQRAIVEDCLALIDAIDLPVRRPEKRDRPPGQARSSGRGPAATPRGRADHRHDARRRDQRHRPVPSARKLCAWAGLTPTVGNSDLKVRHGHISKQGSAWVRWTLVEAAKVARARPPFTRTYAQITRRRGKHIATVAIARKLLARCFYVLKELNEEQRSPGELERELSRRHGRNSG